MRRAVLLLLPMVLLAQASLARWSIDRQALEEGFVDFLEHPEDPPLGSVPPSLKALALADRRLAVEAMIGHLKAYSRSEAFRKEWADRLALDAETNQGEDAVHPPKDPKVAVRQGLERFLRHTEGVDFGAATTRGPNGLRVFVDKVHESKPPFWKMVYRAGREPVEAGRAALKGWLKELS